MTDGLSNEERTLAWCASWNPSFAGIAIVNSDFTFRSVNPQFCDIVGVSPAELIGRRFQDVTPVGVRVLEESNAKLVMEGVIDSYLLPKSYEFTNGKKADVVLLTKGVYSEMGEFLFFLSRIMLDQESNVKLPSLPPKQQGVLVFVKDYSKVFIGVGTAIAAFTMALLQYLNSGGK